MENQMLENYDLVSIQGEVGTWTIVGRKTEEPKYRVQLGQDGASIKFVNSADITLVQKANKPTTEPGLYPSRSIMG
jgi:hypothetical protein